MGQNKPENVVILGAGPGGLCAAWNLVKDGCRVLVLEKEETWGGLAKTIERNGYHYDLGPHNFHSKRDSVMRFVARNLGDRFIEWKMRAQLYFWGRRIEYPFVGTEVLQSLPFLKIAHCGVSFVWTRLKSLASGRFKDDGTYETWVVNRFGRRFYEIFFAPYSLKAWGVPPNELSDVVAKKRIVVRSMIELIRSVLFRTESDHSENSRLVKQHYPRGGVGEISDFFVKGIKEGGGEILTDCHVTGMSLEGGQVSGVSYTQSGEHKVMDFAAEGGANTWQVLSTIPINDLIMMMDHEIPEAVTNAASQLDFTADIFLYLNVNRQDVFGVPLLYFGQDDFPFNRIYDVGLFSRDMVPPGKNAVCVEITCSHGDDTWAMSNEALFEKCMTPLEAQGLLDRSCIDDYHVQRIKHAYPRFRVGYQQKLSTIFKHISDIENLTTFGRQGLFNYANVDDVIWMAFQVVKHLRYRDRLELSHEELMPEYFDY